VKTICHQLAARCQVPVALLQRCRPIGIKHDIKTVRAEFFGFGPQIFFAFVDDPIGSTGEGRIDFVTGPDHTDHAAAGNFPQLQ